MKISSVNINGIGDGSKLEKLHQIMRDDDLDVLFILETHQTTENVQILKRTFENFDVYLRARRPKQRKQYQGRGGVACVVRKGLSKPGPQMKSDDILINNLHLAVVYFVPATSPFAEENHKRMEELQTNLLLLKEKGEVVILTDANAWIGQEPSVIESENESRLWERKSVKVETNNQGKWFVSCMNSVNMIILNGVKTPAKSTFDNLNRQAASIVDFVVDEKVFKKCSDMKYSDYRELLETDHWMISIEIPMNRRTKEVKRTKKRKTEVTSITKRNMNLLKKVTLRDPFWKSYQRKSNSIMTHFELKEDSPIDEDYSYFRYLLHFSLFEALRTHKPLTTTLTARLKTNTDIITLRIRKNHLCRLKKHYPNPEIKRIFFEQIHTVNNALKVNIRREREKFRKDQMDELENLKQTDCRRMWQELKRMAGWNSKEKEIQAVLDDKQEEVWDEEALKVWETSFKKLGIEDLDDKIFDKHFAQDRLNDN